jgi:hypothetical protein
MLNCDCWNVKSIYKIYAMLHAGRLQVWFPINSLVLSIDLILPATLSVAVESTYPLTEMSAGTLPECKWRPVGAWGWQPHRHLWADCLENVGASTSHSSMGTFGLLQCSFALRKQQHHNCKLVVENTGYSTVSVDFSCSFVRFKSLI